MTAGRILIVDDDVRLACILFELLTGEDFQPAHVSNGAAALACLSRRSFDLLILDVNIRCVADGRAGVDPFRDGCDHRMDQ